MRDIEIINEELRLKDEEQLLAVIEKLGRTVLRGDKKDKAEYVRTIEELRLKRGKSEFALFRENSV